MMTMLAHLADALSDRGYNMLLSKVAAHQDGWVRKLQQPGRSDGVILIGQSFEHGSINEAARAGIPRKNILLWAPTTALAARSVPII